MRIKINKDSDTFYFRLDENSIVESEEGAPVSFLTLTKTTKWLVWNFSESRSATPKGSFQRFTR